MKNVMTVMLVLFIGTTAFAQSEMAMERSNADRAAMFSERMGKKLGLNPEQKMKMKEIQMKRLEDQKKLKEDYNNRKAEDADEIAEAKSAMKEDKMKIQEDFHADMKEILTADQYSKWEMMEKDKMKKMGKKDKMKKKWKEKETEDDIK